MNSPNYDIIVMNPYAGRKKSAMKKTDEDLRKDIEDLEKLIEEVKSRNREDLEKLKKEGKPAKPAQVRIDLGAEYSHSLPMNLVVGFLVNFILFFLLIDTIGLAESDGIFVYAGLAGAFTLYETALRRYFLNNQLKLVLYSSGLIFFLLYLVFFYIADLIVLPRAFSFYNFWYPAAFVASFIVLRFAVRSVYAGAVRALANRPLQK